MKTEKVDRSIRDAIVAEYLAGGISLRALDKKYGYNYASIGRWVRASRALPHIIGLAEKLRSNPEKTEIQVVSEEVASLQDQLRLANLKNQLLEALLDFGKEQYGIDLRKKSGTRRS
jgi:transposase-like protein